MQEIDKSQSNQVQNHSNEQILFQSLRKLEASDINPNPTQNKIIDTDESQRRSQEIAPAIYMGSPRINQVITEGIFVVLANSSEGTYFQNFSSVPRTLKFNIQGDWIIDSRKFTAYGAEDCLVKDNPLGCLLIKQFIINNDGKSEIKTERFCHILNNNTDGKIEKNILFNPMETLCFFPNLNPAKEENQGYLVVNWTLVS